MTFTKLPILDTIYKFFTFHDFCIATLPFVQKWEIRRVRKKHKNYIAKLKRKEKIVVAFFFQNESVWKYDKLYWLLEQSHLFEPIVIITPFNVHLYYDKDECISVMNKATQFARSKNYRYVCSYDSQNRSWVDVDKNINPDIVFFTKPYKDTYPKYHLYNFRHKLTLYESYGIACIDIYRLNYNLPFHNLLWKFLMETDYQKDFAKTHSLCKGDNAVVVGALATEKLIDPDSIATDVWKPQATVKKRIIWAPHHTVDYLFNFSNFLVYCDNMLELAEKYKDKVQFAFKPHPVLKVKLINIWGKEKTEAYYSKWTEYENTQIEDGYYMDLFKTSDALIHDCGSFTAEYLYTQKPTLFMVRDENVLSHWNPFGKKCFDQHYHAENLEQIEHFIQDVVLNGNDPMKPQREQFFKDYLYPKDGIMPSQKIMNILKEELGK